jgi:coproporphyrinogen III oxidase-like Fe-S oxidoreductase
MMVLALAKEIKCAKETKTIETIYFGGTPSVLTSD